ncbi:hypothetical protein BH10PSE18_BH10PSE18_40100 [soil metagenome]
MQPSSGGGWRRQSMQCAVPAATGTAQVAQRSAGGAKRAMQASQTGRDGQARQTAHWLGTRRSSAGNAEKSRAFHRDNIPSIY